MWQEPEGGLQELRMISGQEPAREYELRSHSQQDLNSANNHMSMKENSEPLLRPKSLLTG